MTPAIEALLARLDPDDKRRAEFDDLVLDDRVARQLAVWLINRGRPAPEPADAMLAAIADLHQRELDGDTPAGSEWRGLRKEAMDLTDGKDRSPLRSAGLLAEAAAWPVAGTHSGLTDIISALSPVASSVASRATGWTAEDELKAHETMTRLAKENSSASRETMPGLFRAAEPDLARRFVAQLEASNEAYQTLNETVLEALSRIAREHAVTPAWPGGEFASNT